MSRHVRLDRFEEWFIARKARQLAGKAGFTPSDVEDIEQDIRLDVMQRLPRFDPAKSNRHTFIAMVVCRRVASILESRRAEKRNGGRRPQSLNAPIRDAEGRRVEFHQTLGGDARRPGRSEEELRDLRADVWAVVAGLEPRLQRWCKVLEGMGVREAVRFHRVPRSSLQYMTRRIRSALERAGLKGYLNEG